MKVLGISTVAILLLLSGCSGFASFDYDIPLQKVLKGEGGSAGLRQEDQAIGNGEQGTGNRQIGNRE